MSNPNPFVNLFDMFTYVSIDFSEIKDEELLKKLEADGISPDEVTCVDAAYIYENDLEQYANWNSADFDELECADYLRDKIGNYPYYLVFASGCTWDGHSGYKFCDSIEKTLYRGYDITLYIKEVLKGCLICTEHSHDVPMGSRTYIIGITNKEYEKLSEADFDEVEKFVESRAKV